MYVFEGKDNQASVILQEDSLTQEEKNKGIKINVLPEKEEIEGKKAILKADKSKNIVYWDYIDFVEEAEEVVKKTVMTKAQLLKRLTTDELNKVTNYELFLTEEIQDYIPKRMLMKSLWTIFNNLENIDLNDVVWKQDFIQTILYTGLISEERLTEIITP